MGDLAARKEAAGRLQDLTVEIIDAGLGLPMVLAAPNTRMKVPTVTAVRAAQKTSSTESATMHPSKSKGKPPTESKTEGETLPRSSPKVTESIVPASTTSAPVGASTECGGLKLVGKKRPGCTAEFAEQFRKGLKVCSEPVGCQALWGDVLGLADGLYCGRVQVWLFLRPQVFGREVVLDPSLRQVTLHKGILNHCALEETPSPYWSVLDAMSDLGQFTKAEVVDRAAELYGPGEYPNQKAFKAACGIAYDVLKTHHCHPRKRYAGMSHMVVNCGSTNPGKAEIRGRKAHETVEYFEEYKRKLAASRASGEPMVSLAT